MTNAVELKGISKYFASSNVQANSNVDFTVEEGEIHALVGENGAGKSTLMNILYGLHKPDKGQIFVNGNEVSINHPDDAIMNGIGMVHQHFKLVPSFTIAQNIMLGMEPNTLGWLRQKDENDQVEKLANEFGLPVDPRAKVEDLPVGMQQRVEILKSLQRKTRILILDEPTAVLTPQEVRELMGVVKQLSEKGQTIVFITHKLIEVVEVADRVSVMRGGEMIGTKSVATTSIPDMARMMVGREVLFRVDKEPAQPGETIFRADKITVAAETGVPAVLDLSLKVKEGQILGIAGVSGNGQTELVEAISGIRKIELGEIFIDKLPVAKSTVNERRKNGMAHIPEDRIHMGLNLDTNLDENTLLSRQNEPEFNKWGFIRKKAMQDFAQKIITDFSVRGAKVGGEVDTLSGGNMQKIVVGRELAGDPKFILANQPTRGLDVGSIEFVHKTLIEARDKGAGVLLVSVELDEIFSLSDRIAVLYRGQIVGEFQADEVTEEEIGILMAGGSLEDLEKEKN
ncbi:MAG: ABC transporter ATP-binding protein [Anaerolineaceae bacterium]|nr:ABC transporter ATP-binding protein [Anaerolineaceae bacterium]